MSKTTIPTGGLADNAVTAAKATGFGKTGQLVITQDNDVAIYQNKAAADTYSLQERNRKRLRCRAIDHFKIDYDVTTTDNPWKLAYTHLKSNSSLSSVADA